MAINTRYRTLAGNSKVWDDETLAKTRPGGWGGTRDSEDLCRVQVDQHRRGRREATVWQTIFGFALGYVSNLDNRAVIRGGRNEPNLTKEEAIRLGIEWANEDPDRRALIVLDTELVGTPWE